MLPQASFKVLHVESEWRGQGVVAWGVQVNGRRWGRAVRYVDLPPFSTILSPKKGIVETLRNRYRAGGSTRTAGMVQLPRWVGGEVARGDAEPNRVFCPLVDATQPSN